VIRNQAQVSLATLGIQTPDGEKVPYCPKAAHSAQRTIESLQRLEEALS
jgi:hypothetical protein